ncbi:hypothetical protein [Scytonema sp. NUACC26]|uniref:hypothetical protein n=1 Tax=Scytonema sp. NUACC26 TaxID=3140176 RepID=UPI0034DBA289
MNNQEIIDKYIKTYLRQEELKDLLNQVEINHRQYASDLSKAIYMSGNNSLSLIIESDNKLYALILDDEGYIESLTPLTKFPN